MIIKIAKEAIILLIQASFLYLKKGADKVEAYKVEPYKVEPFLDTWGISLNGIPMFQANKFLGTYQKPMTAKRYAYALKKYFEYLDSRGTHYLKAKVREVEAFMLDVTYNNSTVGQISETSQLSYRAVLKMFYSFLIAELNLDQEILAPKKSRSKESFYYGQICFYLDANGRGNGGRENSHNASRRRRGTWRFKAKRTYRKWYTELEIEALASNFKTLRDKVIFLISVRLGCRIDEILTVKYVDYDWEAKVIFVSKSKTATRHLALEDDLAVLIEQYCNTERFEIESRVGICEYLFLNQKINKGQRMEYHNYRDILQRCASRAGMDPEKVITHAGRSTRAAEIAKMIRLKVPGVTYEYFVQTMGWASMNSAKPYLKMLDIDEKKAIAQKISERRIMLRRRDA